MKPLRKTISKNMGDIIVEGVRHSLLKDMNVEIPMPFTLIHNLSISKVRWPIWNRTANLLKKTPYQFIKS